MDRTAVILLAPCALLAGAAVELAVARLRSARAKGMLAFAFCLGALASVAALIPAVRAGGAAEVHLGAWDGPLALVLHVDGLSVLFAFMGSCIGGLVLLYSISYMSHDKSATRFYCTMLIFIGGFMGLVYSANLFIFYLCWEVVGLCSFSLVGFWYKNPRSGRRRAQSSADDAYRRLWLLAGILEIYHRTGSALWTDPTVAHTSPPASSC